MADSISYEPKNKIRIVTATSLFDGHDASINIMRRLLQQGGAEIIHLGHNRSVREIAEAVVEEDAQAVAISSYQGGHMEFFKYLRDMLNKMGRSDAKIFGGGGGVIIPEECAELERSGIEKVYTPEDGRKFGLLGIIADLLKRSDFALSSWPKELEDRPIKNNETMRLARALTVLENKASSLPKSILKQIDEGRRNGNLEKNGFAHKADVPLVLGVTGTGGAGKSSLTDEIIRRFSLEFPEKRLCVFSIDPSKKKTGGALLGDRIRMNAIREPFVFMRSFATRGSKSELSAAVSDAISLARSAGFDLVIVETSGIGQGDTEILSVADVALYVMTSEYGASSQLEKIDMLDFADAIAINKFDRRGAEDAFRDVKAQLRRTRFGGQNVADDVYPLFGTIASKFNDDGVNALYRHLILVMNKRCGKEFWQPKIDLKTSQRSTFVAPIVPQNRVNYLSEIADTVRRYHQDTALYAEISDRVYGLEHALKLGLSKNAVGEIEAARAAELKKLPLEVQTTLSSWQEMKAAYRGDLFTYQVRDKNINVQTFSVSLCGLKIPKVAVPNVKGYGDIVRYVRSENFPGSFPYTAGVFAFRRADEDPKRQFAGEGGPARTNKRFHYLSANDPAKRLSTAFDSVTLYGEDPAERPDVFGKVGESGVSIASLDDMKLLYDGFDLCDANTSVSMTINGPAPIILAYFMNTAIDQQVKKLEAEKGRILTPHEFTAVRAKTLSTVRGTVQADILKEDQAQNTCIFSIDFALKMMGDIQQFFIENDVRNYYSVSISGYHIAEAGANPITQLAFTLANGFTYVEYYLNRGMKIDDFAANLSYFFSNGMDPEYSVIGRVARRIWAIAIRDMYKGNERSQKLKYHIQTSGRSLHAQEIDFNDIRTTLQALLAIADNCNSLHTNSYDEAITTPTEESVRRSMAIQMILNREFGPLKNENSNQGSYFLEWLTDEVEKSVLEEFDRISSRGGVLGAMETQYQRGRIQEESLYYESLKSSGKLPIIGVNTFVNPKLDEMAHDTKIELARASYDEKSDQLKRNAAVKSANPAATETALRRLQEVALAGGNIFAELLNTTRVATLGQITAALYAVGGQYRRSL